MDKENKGLADTQDGDFILNESGTSVSNDVTEGPQTTAYDEASSKTDLMDKVDAFLLQNHEDPILSNDIASDEESRLSEGIIKPYDDVFHDHKPQEDMGKISSTDDV